VSSLFTTPLKNDEGEVLDSSQEREPLSYLEGAQNIISGLEEALLTEKGQGDEAQVSLDPKTPMAKCVKSWCSRFRVPHLKV